MEVDLRAPGLVLEGCIPNGSWQVDRALGPSSQSSVRPRAPTGARVPGTTRAGIGDLRRHEGSGQARDHPSASDVT